MKLTTIAVFAAIYEAEAVRGLLEGEGIAVFLPDEQMATMYPAGAFGGVRVQVADEDAAEAKRILEAYTTAQVDDEWSSEAPE